MENNQEGIAKTEALMANFVLEMHNINKNADKLDKAYHSAQKRFEEITKRSDAMLEDFEETAKKNEQILAAIQRHADVIASQVTRMESSLKAIIAMDTFLKTLDGSKTTERMTGVIKNDMNELTSRFEKLIEKRSQEMLTQLISELQRNNQTSTAPSTPISPASQAIIEWKSIVELHEEAGGFPFFVRMRSWTEDYCLRVDRIAGGKAIGVDFKNGRQRQQKNDCDVNDKKYRLIPSPEYKLNDDELPF